MITLIINCLRRANFARFRKFRIIIYNKIKKLTIHVYFSKITKYIIRITAF